MTDSDTTDSTTTTERTRTVPDEQPTDQPDTNRRSPPDTDTTGAGGRSAAVRSDADTESQDLAAPLGDHYDPDAVERAARAHWEAVDAGQRADDAADGDPFTLVDGPPFTSGRMHCGNLWGKLLKDAVLRYHRMQGQDVRARPGYDTHSQSVERAVEADHDFSSTAELEAYGVDRFVDECRAFVDDQLDAMTAEFRDMGVWMDWERTYRTMDPSYVETVWSAFAALHDRGFLDRGDRVVNTCPSCERTLSDAELDYEARTARAAYVSFPLVDHDGALLTWTTTPWTVVGNRFVAVDADADYATVETPDGRYHVAAARVEPTMDALGVSDYEVVETRSGEDLVGWRYDHPLAPRLDAHPDVGSDAERNADGRGGVVADADYVEVSGPGTGLVHSAPGFGHDDETRGRDLGLEPFAPVGPDGRFTVAAGPFEETFVHDDGTDSVLDALAAGGSLAATEPHDHDYPVCPRCGTQVVRRAAEQWLVAVSELKPDLLDALAETEWHPEDARDGRFRNVVESAPDWNLSRDRYWGTPVPVWTCGDCNRSVVVGSVEDLVERTDLGSAPDDLHRPVVDGLVLDCPDCGGAAERVDDVLDVWFDSAVASWASLGLLPDEVPDPTALSDDAGSGAEAVAVADRWPADLVVEGHDQTRGWFQTQLVLGVALAGRAPYDEVVMHGFANLDGEAMSKSTGHVLRPPEVVEEHGRDPLRARLLSADPHGRDLDMDTEMAGVAEARRRLDVVWNVYRFATTYAAEDGHEFEPALRRPVDDLPALDRWLVSRLAAAVETATEAFEDDRSPDAALEATLDFLVEDVSRFYLQAVRERVWESAETERKAATYDVLGTALSACARLLAPLVPFLAERLYALLGGDAVTVHAADWPEAPVERDEGLEARMAALRDCEEAVNRARAAMDRKRRWPVAEVVVEPDSGTVAAAVERHGDLLAERVNADRVRRGDRVRDRVVEPDMAAMGPAVGAAAERVAERVRGRPADDLPVEVTVDAETHVVGRPHVEVVEHAPDGFEAAEFGGGSVRVSTAFPDELRRRGLAADLVRRAQKRRRELDLDFEDRVVLTVRTPDEDLRTAVRDHADRLREAVRAVVVVVEDGDPDGDDAVDGSPVEVAVDRADTPDGDGVSTPA